MELGLEGKTVLVSGASAGIGYVIAREFAREGAHVFATARRENLLENLASEVVAFGGTRPELFSQDFLDEDAAQGIAEAALAKFGRIDIIVNNAGQGAQPKVSAPEEEWTRSMTLNYLTHRRLTNLLLPAMISNHWGRVISIGSAGNPPKASLERYTKDVAWEVSKLGITANCIQPGKIKSEQHEIRYSPEVQASQNANDIAIGEQGRPEDVAYLACFLASPQARYITGAAIPVNGGFRLKSH